MGFNISDLELLGDGPGNLDPFGSLPAAVKGKPAFLVQVEVTDVFYSTDPGKKPAGLNPSKGFDRKMHYVAFACKSTLVDAEALELIEHPEDEPLPAREFETWLYLMDAEAGPAWRAEEREILADKVRRAEDILVPMFKAAGLPLQPFDGKAHDGCPERLAKRLKGRRGPLGKVITDSWSEIKGMVFRAEITRREWQGKSFFDYRILDLCPPDEVGQVTARGAGAEA